MQIIKSLIPESIALLLDLFVEFVISHQMNILNPVLIGDSNIIPISFQQFNPVLTKVFNSNGEVQSKVLHIPIICFQVEQILVQLRIQRVQMININIYQSLAKQLGEEECCQRKLNQHVLIQGFAKNSANEEVMLSALSMYLVCCWVGVEHLVKGQGEETTVGVKRCL